jgi:hypothetical protein
VVDEVLSGTGGGDQGDGADVVDGPGLAAGGLVDLVVMIDCTASMTSRGTGRHAVERAAVRAHLQFAAIFDLPFCYVFDNLGVLTPMDVRAAGQDGPHSRVGSGAPTTWSAWP